MGDVRSGCKLGHLVSLRDLAFLIDLMSLNLSLSASKALVVQALQNSCP